MKQLLPWIRIRNIWNSDLQKRNSFLHPPGYLILIFMLTAIMVQPAHSQINDDGSQHSVGTAGGYQDLLLPNNPQIVAISFGLAGGDGGYARVKDKSTFGSVSYKSNGGAGALVGATFPVGSGPGEIPPGSYIRFVVGEKGQSGSRDGTLGFGFMWGGGGGGSAVLYDPPGPTGWTLLAVAGGGGGAYQGMDLYLSTNSEDGQGGRSDENGGAGSGGFFGHDGGSGGAGGDGSGDAGAGGGAYTDGGGITCIVSTIAEGGAGGTGVGYGGSDEGCLIFSLDTWSNGGAGYGGGGAGYGGGGGGGGYSGGGAGEGGRGGGGGSYVSSLSTSYSITPGGTTGSPKNGNITYLVTLNQPPVAKCKSAMIYLDAGGNATLAVSDINDGSYDPDGSIASISLNKTNFDCSNVGTNTVTLTVKNNKGATDDCQATVTVVDNIAPKARCKNITIQLDDNGVATIAANQLDDGSRDACGLDPNTPFVASKTTFGCGDVGENEVTLTVKDANGNESTCTSTVTVQDNVPPDAQCKNITIQLDAAGQAIITADQLNDGSFDACGLDPNTPFIASQTTFDCSDVGENEVTLTVKDANGNESICTSKVTVEDNVAPDAQCKDITIQLDDNGVATITADHLDDGSSDACGLDPNTPFVASKTTFGCGDVGNNEVTLTVRDANGNESTCTSTVTVQDNVAPEAKCKDITIQLDADGNASITADHLDDGSSDACGLDPNTPFIASQTTFDCSDVGENEVTLTVKDANGNESICTSTVTVQDNVAPDARCKDITIQLDGNGVASITADQLDDGSSDACGLDPNTPFVASRTTFDCGDVGDNEVTLTVRDANGNESTCTSTVTVQDNVAPDARCKDITIQLDDNGVATIAANQLDDGSRDACGLDPNTPFVASRTTFDCSDVGENEVTLTVMDVNGNESICTSMVTVQDNVAPEAKCKEITVQLDGNGVASITADQLDDGSSDACGLDPNTPFIASRTTFDCGDVGDNEVTLTVRDANGNESICTSKVTVQDNVAPEAKCKDITVYLDATGNASITPDDVDNGSSDNCSISNKSLDITSFDCSDVGYPVTVTLTVKDPSGNQENCEAIVTVLDTISPVAVCQNITVQLDATGNASIRAADIDGGSMDACGIASLTASRTSFTYADLGNNTVTLTVTDMSENTATCKAIVTVEDNIRPNVRTRNVTVLLNKQGKASVSVDMIDNGSSDNCRIVDMWLEGDTEYDCGDEGVHEVVLNARDQSGNIGTWNAFVTVKFYKPDFKNKYGVANGDTIHLVDCQVPRDIFPYDLEYNAIKPYAEVITHLYREELPENAPWSMYDLWRYEYVVKDACYHTYKFSYYVALYDLAPPLFQRFPRDTTVTTPADVPPVDGKVKIIDICQYVVWDTVMTMPVLDPESGDTLGYTRRWMARDPSGHQSFRDQMIWLGSGHRKQYSLITGRIADENHIAKAKYAGEAGTNGLPVSLYRLDTTVGTRTWIDSWTTGDWMGAQGTYYFLPVQPGKYQVKIDSAICLVDTLKFSKELWSDTLVLSAGKSLDQGWMITRPCTGVELIDLSVQDNESLNTDYVIQPENGTRAWKLYPNPSTGYLRIDFKTDKMLNYRIYDALGRSVKMGVYHRGQMIDIHGLNAGVYHIQLSDQQKILGTKNLLLME